MPSMPALYPIFYKIKIYGKRGIGKSTTVYTISIAIAFGYGILLSLGV